MAENNKNNVGNNINCKFYSMNYELLRSSVDFGKFDFIFDWRFLHGMTDLNKRNQYVSILNKLLKNDGTYLSLAFARCEDDNNAIRTLSVGNSLYFATKKETNDLFSKCFDIINFEQICVDEKPDLEILSNLVSMKKIM